MWGEEAGVLTCCNDSNYHRLSRRTRVGFIGAKWRQNRTLLTEEMRNICRKLQTIARCCKCFARSTIRME